MAGQVVIIMGSKGDQGHANAVKEALASLGVHSTLRVASAHKSVRHLLSILECYHDAADPIVFVAIAGRSNALGGMVDANSAYPVITCPPPSTAFGGADIYSSLRMPSGVAPLVVLEPEAAALAAAKILALSDPSLRMRVMAYQAQMTAGVVKADGEVL